MSSKSPKDNIIPGYNGIMPLDLQNIDIQHRKQAIDQHYDDIKKYIRDQSEMSPRLRYENTIERIQKMHKQEFDALEKRVQDAKQRQMKLDTIREEDSTIQRQMKLNAEDAIQRQIKLNASRVK
jgi:hypothetical protein